MAEHNNERLKKRRKWPFTFAQTGFAMVTLIFAVVIGSVGAYVGEQGARNPVYASTVQATQRLAVASVSPLASDSSSWYCNWYLPGQGGVTQASVLLANTSAKQLNAKVKIYSGKTEVKRRIEIPAHSFLKYPQPVTPTVQSGSMSFIANGGGTVAEIEVAGPSGNTVSPCNSSPSAKWVALGTNTLTGSDSGISIFNPFGQDAVIDVTMSSSTQDFSPGALKGIVIAPHRAKLINVSQYFPGQSHVAVSVSTRIGRVVVDGLIQRDDKGNTGLSAFATFPATASTWRFPVGELSANQNQEITVYNPNPYNVTAIAQFSYLGLKQGPSVSTTSTTSTTEAVKSKSKSKSTTKKSTTKKSTAKKSTAKANLPTANYSVKETIQPYSIAVISVKSDTSIKPGYSYKSQLSVLGGHGVVAADAFIGSVGNPNVRYQVLNGIPLVSQHWIALFDPSSMGLTNAQAWLAPVDTGNNSPLAQKTPLVDLGPTYLAPKGKAPAQLPILQAQTAHTSKSVLKSRTHLNAVGKLTSTVTGVIVSSKSPFALETVIGPAPNNWYVVPVLPFAN